MQSKTVLVSELSPVVAAVVAVAVDSELFVVELEDDFMTCRRLEEPIISVREFGRTGVSATDDSQVS